MCSCAVFPAPLVEESVFYLCIFLPSLSQVAVLCLVTQSCPTLCDPMDCMQSIRLLYPWGFSRQEYWSGLPCHPPGGLPNIGIKPRSPTLQVDSLPFKPPGKPCHRLTDHKSSSLFPGFLSCCIDLCVFSGAVPYSFDYWSFVVKFGVRQLFPPALFGFLIIVSAIQCLLCFCTNLLLLFFFAPLL